MATMSTPIQPESGNAADTAIPSLIFDNRTELEALHFDTLDQHATAFHIIVAKTGYALGKCNADGLAPLVELDDPAELNVEDRYHDDDPACSVKMESDLAPYKPFCDVIVNAEAHAPRGKAIERFNVRLTVQGPDSAAPLPIRPTGLNPLQGPTSDQLALWQRESDQARNKRVAGTMLIDKVLTVTGERTLSKSLLGSWKLTAPRPFAHLPLRYEFAYGGECRVEADDAAASRIDNKHRLTPEQIAQHPEKVAPPVAHDACMTNPLGRGFATRWYVDAVRPAELPAPRIEYPAEPFTADIFSLTVDGKALSEPAGMGFIGRAWLPRRALVGKVEDKPNWGKDEVPRLPEDFDFRYWNGAPVDQQCTHLNGEERFTLTNLCAVDSPFARPDADGNVVLRFILPRQALFALCTERNGQFSTHSLVIDTVVIDPDAGRVELVWRVCLPADGNILEARLMQISDEAQLQRLKGLQTPAAPE